MARQRVKVGRALRLGIIEMALFLLGVLFTRREIWQFHASTFTIAFWQEGLLIPLAALDGAITGGFGSRRRQVQNVPAYKGLLRWAMPAFFVLFVACSALCERLNKGVFPTAINDYVRTAGLLVVIAGMYLRLWSQLSAPSELEKLHDTRTADVPVIGTQPEEGTDSAATNVMPDAPGGATVTVSEAATTPSGPAERPPGQDSATNVVTPAADETESIFPQGPHKLLRHPDASGHLLSLWGLPLVFNAWLPLLALPGVLVLLKWHISDQEAFRISQLGEPYLEYRKNTWNLIPYVY